MPPSKTLFTAYPPSPIPLPDSVSTVLAERGRSYTTGTYQDRAYTSQALKDAMSGGLGGTDTHLPPGQMEALDMIAHKIARIVAGGGNDVDRWHDIAGYAMLAAESCDTPKQQGNQQDDN